MIHQKANEEFGLVGKRRGKTRHDPACIRTAKLCVFKILQSSLLPKSAFSDKVHPRNEPISIQKPDVAEVSLPRKPSNKSITHCV